MLDSKTEHIFILGYSGHSYVVVDSIFSQNRKVLGYFDQQEVPHNPFQLIYAGSEDATDFKAKVQHHAVFPSVGSNAIRKKMLNRLTDLGIEQTVVQHQRAIVSESASIGLSTLIAPGAIVNALSNIGQGCIINSGAIVEHECTIGDYTHIAPGAVLAGNVSVGENSFIGANSVVKQGVKIGKNVTVGAGSVVIGNIPDDETWVGNPAQKMESK